MTAIYDDKYIAAPLECTRWCEKRSVTQSCQHSSVARLLLCIADAHFQTNHESHQWIHVMLMSDGASAAKAEAHRVRPLVIMLTA